MSDGTSSSNTREKTGSIVYAVPYLQSNEANQYCAVSVHKENKKLLIVKNVHLRMKVVAFTTIDHDQELSASS